jgi:ribose 5-phosphate isomerase B
MPKIKKIYIASDHAGYNLKSHLLNVMTGFDIVDCGTNSTDSVDYPDFAKNVADLMDGSDSFGILICGSGIGISIAANRYSHIRAALCEDKARAMLARQHNNANVLVLAARFLNDDQAFEVVKTFFSTEFLSGRHQKRIDKLGC